MQTQMDLTPETYKKLVNDVSHKMNDAVGAWGRYIVAQLAQLRPVAPAPSVQDTTTPRVKTR